LSTVPRRVGRYRVAVSHPERLLFPADGLTKADLVDYYVAVAPVMLPHVRGRPVTMHRFPDGIEAGGFIQKEVPESAPAFVGRARVEKEGGWITHAVCDNAASLAYLANIACITPHVWLCRVDRPGGPDRLVFDLDPPGQDFAPVRQAAHWMKALLDALDLPSFLMTTGSRGAHVTVPLDGRADFETVRAFADAVAGRLVAEHPGALTTAARKAERGTRLYLDTLRNNYAQTAVAPYAVRAKPGAPVATPISWSELDEPGLDARRWTLRTVFERLGGQGDAWDRIGRHARSVATARRRLDRLYPPSGVG
jgi:bifunctional non-homologous end joining protein LigD